MRPDDGISAPLLEREPHLAAIDAAIVAAGGGRGRALLVEGHGGLGKSRLLREAAERASGLEHLRARSSALEQDFPFAVALQLVEPALRRRSDATRDELLTGAAALAAPLLDGTADAIATAPASRLFSLIHGLSWLIVNLAHHEPLLITVDDAHWADVPSLRLLSYLAARLEDVPLCLVVACRPGAPPPRDDLLGAIRDIPATTTLSLPALSATGVAALVERRLPDADPAFCIACSRHTGGNPLFVEALADEVARRGLAGTAKDATTLRDLVPDDVASAVRARVDTLSAPARRLIEAAAVLGDEVELRHAAALAELDGVSAASALDDLAAAGLVLRERSAVAFAHPLVATAVREALPVGALGAAHRRAAELLRAAGAPPERVAGHLAAAPPLGVPWAADALRAAAARALAEGAPEPAARWLRRALDEAPDRRTRATVLTELARAELALGDPQGRRRLAEAAALEDDERRRALLLLELGRAETSAGDLERAAQTLARARDAAGDDEALAVEIDAAWVVPARHVGALHDRAVRLTARLLSRPAPSSHAERALLVAAANHAAFSGEPFLRVRELAHRGLGGTALLAEETSDGLTWTLGAAALGWADDFAAVEELANAALDDARRRGSLEGFANACHARAYAMHHTGRVAEAAADARQAIESRPDPDRTLLPFSCVQLAWTEIERGDLAAAEEAIERFEPDERWAELPAYVLVLDARGRLALAHGRADDALELLCESGRLATERGILNPAVVPWRSAAVAAAVGLERWETAQTLAAEELRLARTFGSPRALAAALRSTGLATRSVEPLRAAIEALSDAGASLERAHALVDLGAAERRAGRRAQARPVLRSGLAAAHAAGALRLASRAEQELAAAGDRQATTALRGPSALTPSELRVATMAAQGMTNREIAQALFVTVKAVRFHLGNVYRKLDVSDRAALPDALSGD